MIVQICVGSSCHIKNSEKIVELFRDAVTRYRLENDVALAGSFCSNRCNRVGVTVTVDDTVYVGVTPESFETFFEEKVLNQIQAERRNGNGVPDSEKIQL